MNGMMRVTSGLVLVALSGCSVSTETNSVEATAEPGAATTVEDASVASVLGILDNRKVFLPQFAGGDDGSLYVVWSEPVTEGRGGNLMLSRRGGDGSFGAPVQVNDLPGTAGAGSLDEGRAAVSVAAGGLMAVAWTDRTSTVRVAISADGGASFAPSVALNSDAGTRAYRGFVDMDIDAAGVVHAAWIDGRFAPRGAEEPAELFYARVEEGEVTEINLTEDQVDSICGCCRIDVDVRADNRLVIAFRNTGGGYRDIWRIEAGDDRAFGEAARLGPPMWELNGCPVIGPLNVGEATLWSEASTGKRRILVADETEAGFELVIEDDDEWAIERPPRRIIGSDADAPMLLLPGRPGGKVLRGAGLSWEVVADEAPRWAMSAALIDGFVVFLGSLDGDVLVESRPLDF